MRHFLIAAALAAAGLAGIAAAPPVARATQGMLAWDRCLLESGTVTKTFACDTNTGSETIVGSFVPPAGITQFQGLEITIDLMTNQESSWPNWWAFRNAGTCRTSALTMQWNFQQGDGYGCTKLWGGEALGGIHSFQFPYFAFAGYRARFSAVVAVPPQSARPLSADTTYDAFTLTIDHAKTVGDGACSGCDAPVCATITKLVWTQPVGVGDFLWDGGGQSLLLWQSSVPTCPASIPTRHATWGALKSLYR